MNFPQKFSTTIVAIIYNPEGELCGSHLIDTNSGREDRGHRLVCPLCVSPTAKRFTSPPI